MRVYKFVVFPSIVPIGLGVTKRVWINGEAREVPGSVVTILALLADLAVPPQGTLVELNGMALFARDFDRTPVSDGDRVELVRIAAGG